jgi:putative hydrolases of HD superfamily
VKNVLKLVSELGHLQKICHEGWRFVGIQNPKSIASHSLRAAQIGYLLAKKEGFDNPHLVCSMVVFHDMGECRVGDIHKVAARYVQADERGAVKDQVENLDPETKDELFSMWEDVESRRSLAGNLAKDSDLLEQALTGKELVQLGYELAQDWIDYVGKNLKTKSGTEFFDELVKGSPSPWWDGVKKR